MNTFNSKNSTEDLIFAGDPQLYWFDSSSIIEISNSLCEIGNYFDIYIFAKNEAPSMMSANIAKKRGALGEFGFFDLSNQCAYKETVVLNQRTFFVDVLRVKPNIDRCAEFLSKQRDELGKNIFLFGVPKGSPPTAAGKCLNDYIYFLREIDTRKYFCDGVIAGYIITEIYLKFLQKQIAENSICIFHLFSDYSSRFLTIVACCTVVEASKLENPNTTASTLVEKDYQLVAPTYCFD